MTDYISEDDLKYILSLPRGRKVIWDILTIGGFARQPFIANDPSTTAFQCGNMNTGIIVFAECNSVSPELTAMMFKEQGNADRERSKQSTATDRADDTAGSGRPESASSTDVDYDIHSSLDRFGLGVSTDGQQD